MFSGASVRTDAAPAQRPVAFVWNGGPGSSSLWLHWGAVALVRVAIDGTGPVVPPGRLVLSDGSLLGTTDIVFIAAPRTGYRRIGADT